VRILQSSICFQDIQKLFLVLDRCQTVGDGKIFQLSLIASVDW